MVKLDVFKTAFAGFDVIRRNPMAVLGWSLFMLVLGVAPFALLFGGVFSTISHLATLEKTGAEPAPEQVLPMVMAMFVAMPVLMIISLLMRAVLTGAVFRAVLEPQNSRWAFLRLGAQELWLILVSVVMSMGLGTIYMALLVPTFPISFMLQGHHDAAPWPLFILPLWFLVVIAVMGFLLVRFSMALPMSFARRGFHLFESWTLTRGNGWNIVLVALLQMVFVMIVEMLVWLLIVIVAAVVFGTNFGLLQDEARLQAFFSQDPSVLMGIFAPWIALAVVVGSLLGAVFTAIFIAPWAEAYRQLTAKAEPVAA